MTSAQKQSNQKWAAENPEKMAAYKRAWYVRNREAVLLKAKLQYQENPQAVIDKVKQWNHANPEKRRVIRNRWTKNNPIKAKACIKESERKNPNLVIGRRLRTRICLALRRQSLRKDESLVELLGCSLNQLKAYLSSKFLPGMSWDNYGIKGWHIDHILPCDSFDLSNLADRKKCFHFTNLQPLWAADNLKKWCFTPDELEARAA